MRCLIMPRFYKRCGQFDAARDFLTPQDFKSDILRETMKLLLGIIRRKNQFSISCRQYEIDIL